VPGADKLLQLTIDLGDEERTIVAGIALCYTPEELVGKKIIVLANLEPATIRGVQSQGMLLAAGDERDVVLLTPERDLPAGKRVR
jgi:methionyl-tRNA synthetase